MCASDGYGYGARRDEIRRDETAVSDCDFDGWVRSDVWWIDERALRRPLVEIRLDVGLGSSEVFIVLGLRLWQRREE